MRAKALKLLFYCDIANNVRPNSTYLNIIPAMTRYCYKLFIRKYEPNDPVACPRTKKLVSNSDVAS